MPYRLVRTTATGQLVTENALAHQLRQEDFTVPAMPAIPFVPAEPVRDPGEPFNEFMIRWKNWIDNFKKPYLAVIYQRQALCEQYALDLAADFQIAKLRARGKWKLWPPPNGIYQKFALILTGSRNLRPVTDPINWICFRNDSDH